MLYEVERVRLADQTPVALELVHIPEYLCPNLDRFNLGSQSLYQILEENYGLALAAAQWHFPRRLGYAVLHAGGNDQLQLPWQ
jgi:DNA-binding GntR family transcriptional regulator